MRKEKAIISLDRASIKDRVMTIAEADLNIGALIYTHNRLDDARINMEIIRHWWPQIPQLKQCFIVHAYNGCPSWWPEPYLEDQLVRTENTGHYSGAACLLDSGVMAAANQTPELDYLIVLAADTWCLSPSYLHSVISSMRQFSLRLATVPWGVILQKTIFQAGAAADFFIIDLKWAMRSEFFPLRYNEFVRKYEDFFMYGNEPIKLERVFSSRFLKAINKSGCVPSENIVSLVANEQIYYMNERHPVHMTGKDGNWCRNMECQEIGLACHHEPTAKRKFLWRYNPPLGDFGQRFMDAADLGYYNGGLTRTAFVSTTGRVECVD